MLAIYGAQSIYGSEIPLTALDIVMKVNQILTAILVGIASGSQPIVGYNYGVGKLDRVKLKLLLYHYQDKSYSLCLQQLFSQDSLA